MKSLFIIAVGICLTALEAKADVSVTINTHNNSSKTIDSLELKISALGCSGGFFSCYNDASIPAGGSISCSGSIGGAYGSLIYICQAIYEPDDVLVPNQTWTGGGTNVILPSTGSVTWDVYLYGGAGGGNGNPPSNTQTNSGCITLNNSTGQVQYYQFAVANPSVNGGAMQGMSGCSTNISASLNGSPQTQGNDADNANNFMAIYPGQSVTVCHTDVSPIGSGSEFMAFLAPPDSYPCGLLVGQPLCVALCGGDGIPVASPAFGGTGTLAATAAESAGSGASGAPNPNSDPTTNSMFNGTNGIIWQESQTNGGLELDSTGKEGFAALHNDNIKSEVAAAANATGIETAMGNAASTIAGAIRSNSSGSNIVISNQISLTNFPTNYPDQAAIGLLGTIATNTDHTNSFDTNLDASASAIASNTAAPLAYTNLNIGSYSTNPSDVVNYASNTLAGPLNQSMQNYSQDAASAAGSVDIGGSPGSLLVISFDVPGIGSYTIDCNPLDNPDIADFASWFRTVMEWLVGIGFIGMVLRDGMNATRTTLLTPQGQFPKLTILGNSIGWPLAAVYIVAIIAALAAVPFAIVTWFSVGGTGQMWWQQIAVNPFSGAGVGRAVSLSLWLADQVLPMSYIVSSSLYYIAFRFTLNGIVTVAATIVRALMA